MLEKKYKNIVYFITLAIIATIAAQVYWNVKNYEANKQQVTNQIQSSFDNTVEKYYTGIAIRNVLSSIENDTIIHNKKSFSFKNGNSKSKMIIGGNTDLKNIDFSKELTHSGDSIQIKILSSPNPNQLSGINFVQDSLIIKEFTNKIWLTFQDDIINLKKIDSLFRINLVEKEINLSFGIKYDEKSVFSNTNFTKEIGLENFPKKHKSTFSSSSYLHHNSNLELRYIDKTVEILKRMLGSIILSLLLSGIIIGCLLFLLNVISKQKQLAEVKNDLISNITHEFKTPIATIGVALESIKNFNVIDDVEKTKKYINISSNQLSKLNVMVEKLLETASLDSDNLNLQKEKTNIFELLQTIVEKHQMQTDTKILTFNKPSSSIFVSVDVFHFENAINNIIDNAIKYGGNNISIELNQQKNAINISISDDGNFLKNSDKEKIFEQFYRVPKGNTHDIKGFGIGLYYAKKIIEKHNGTIDLELKNNLTIFKISLPNE